MGEERRANPRVRAYRPVRLTQRADGRVVETLAKDLSLAGMRFLSTTLFPVSTELNLELILSNGESPMNLHAKTAWFNTIPQSEQFDIGVMFMDIPEQDKRRLSAYINRLAQKPSFSLAS